MHLSSFLIRCRLEGGRADTFVAQHVQSGETFRSHDWGQVGDWVRSQSNKALEAAPLSGVPEPREPEAEDAEPVAGTTEPGEAQ